MGNTSYATRVVDSIRDLGLEISPQKTECIFFHNKKKASSFLGPC